MLHVLVVNTRSGVTIADVQGRLVSHAWYRVAPNVWIVQSNFGSAGWVEHLLPLVKPSGTLFVSQLNISDHQGWMDEKFWSWLNQRI